MSEIVPTKETKAQKAERLKREKNPWAVFDEVRAFALSLIHILAIVRR